MGGPHAIAEQHTIKTFAFGSMVLYAEHVVLWGSDMSGREFCRGQTWAVPGVGSVPMECAAQGDTRVAWGAGFQGWRDTAKAPVYHC